MQNVIPIIVLGKDYKIISNGDIDSNRTLIHIKQAKGKKYRYTLLSHSFLKLIREYYLAYQAKAFLFEGQNAKDIRYIEELLAHSNPKKAMISHVTQTSLKNSKNPFDEL
ncbi:MAG: hypothetical protein JXR05_15985 [Flavobacteriaceae bacterium]